MNFKKIFILGIVILALFALSVQGVFADPIPGGTLHPDTVPKYQMPLVKPPVLPFDGRIRNRRMKNPEYYEIAVRQFEQQILPPGKPMTTVWSYGPNNDVNPDGSAKTVAQGGRYFYPAFTLENKYRRPAVIKWINGLVDTDNNYLPHLLPVDQTLHWANPPGPRDARGEDPNSYTGPVPIVTHVHGAHTTEESDGYPEAWYLPAADNIPGDIQFKTGTFFDYFNAKYGYNWDPNEGAATFTYPNDQRPTTLWYHDHTLGMTRLNVYAGPAGFYLIRGGPDDMVYDSRDGTSAILPGPAPDKDINPFGTFYEIPIAIQDRSFNADGSLFYPDNRAFFEELDPNQLQIPFIPDPACFGEDSDVSPIWQPEFFGNMMVVNGFTWPYLDVEQRRYRFRLLNGCNSRFLILDFSAVLGVKVWQIGAEGGFLPAPVDITDVNGGRLLMGPAERADVIVDFTNVQSGLYVLANLGPDEPFGGGEPGVDFDPADPNSTGQVMQFRVGPAMSADNTTPPEFLQLPAITLLEPTSTRKVSLNEEESKTVFVSEDDEGNIILDCDSEEPFGPTSALLGTLDPNNMGNPLLWMDDITENPGVGDTEEWEIYNFTADAHPIHVHLVQFQVVNRQDLEMDDEGVVQPVQLIDPNIYAPEAWEMGFKDTVIAYPGQVTRIKARFDTGGFYVWHCHIVEHEDNEMMRPYHVGEIDPNAPAQ